MNGEQRGGTKRGWEKANNFYSEQHIKLMCVKAEKNCEMDMWFHMGEFEEGFAAHIDTRLCCESPLRSFVASIYQLSRWAKSSSSQGKVTDENRQNGWSEASAISTRPDQDFHTHQYRRSKIFHAFKISKVARTTLLSRQRFLNVALTPTKQMSELLRSPGYLIVNPYMTRINPSLLCCGAKREMIPGALIKQAST